jgi:acyl-CoA reductase-like NAD-dependent aldehyde dehydrogenase
VAGRGGRRTFETLNPATGEALTEVAEAGEEDVDRAVAAARAAFGTRSGAHGRRDRGALLWRIADIIEARADELARLETLDNGKPIREARMIDVRQPIDCFRYYAGWATRSRG